MLQAKGNDHCYVFGYVTIQFVLYRVCRKLLHDYTYFVLYHLFWRCVLVVWQWAKSIPFFKDK